MTKLLPGVIAMATIVVASNILVQFLLLDGLLTWGAFTYPFAFLVTDLMNRVYGPAAARRVAGVDCVGPVPCLGRTFASKYNICCDLKHFDFFGNCGTITSIET
jgi:hypothetical protein